MKFYRIEVHGHLIEARYPELGSREVLLDGRPVKQGWIDRVLARPSHFDITDEKGQSRHVEVLWIQPARTLGLSPRIRITVDGIERAVVEHDRTANTPRRCPYCGYDVHGLEPVNGEVQCPECGRHTSAK